LKEIVKYLTRNQVFSKLYFNGGVTYIFKVCTVRFWFTNYRTDKVSVITLKSSDLFHFIEGDKF